MRDILRSVVFCGAFALPFLPLVVSNSLFFPFITGKAFLFRVFVEIIFAAWVVLALYDKAYRPKFSWILGAFVWFVGIIALADALGVSPHKSFWSNYERMEGFVTIAHLLVYFVVVGSVLTTQKLWNRFWNTSIFVAVLMSLYAFGQLAGSFQINQGGVRVDGRMGNAAYFAIYMLFHAFMAVYLLIATRVRGLRIMYAVFALTFVFILIETATRGAILALAGGTFISALYIALFEREQKLVRKIAIGGIVTVMVVVAGFYAIKDQPFIKNDPVLGRLSSISLNEAKTRFAIWSIAIEGIKERPLLGWGQENFNYVFNQHYKAELYGQEPWFDRVHNLAFDWLIAGGIIGFLAYVFLLLSAIYYVAIRPLRAQYQDTFSVTERGLLLGLLLGYVAHTLLVFDNLISYLLFASVIAMIHSRVAETVPRIDAVRVDDSLIKQVVLPVALVLCVGVIYVVNVPSLLAGSDLIKALRAPDPETQMMYFEQSLNRGSLGQQEIREQLTRAAQQTVLDPNLGEIVAQQYPNLSEAELQQKTNDIRTRYGTLAETELDKQIAETPDDARILVFQASFYRAMNHPERSLEILKRARALSPEKQQVLFEIGFAYTLQGDYENAKKIFKEAFDLAPANVDARLYYAATAIYTQDQALLLQLITPEYQDAYDNNDIILRALYETKAYTPLINMLKKRVKLTPDNLQLRVSLAAVQDEAGNRLEAIKTLEQAIKDFPEFKEQGEQFILQLKAGKAPGTIE